MENRILLVEDDPAIADAVELNLKIIGCTCMRFDDGQEKTLSLTVAPIVRMEENE